MKKLKKKTKIIKLSARRQNLYYMHCVFYFCQNSTVRSAIFVYISCNLWVSNKQTRTHYIISRCSCAVWTHIAHTLAHKPCAQPQYSHRVDHNRSLQINHVHRVHTPKNNFSNSCVAVVLLQFQNCIICTH